MNIDDNIEYASKDEIKAFQEAEMTKLLDYVKVNSPYYKQVFKDNNIDVGKIKTLEDFRKIPFTTKIDLQVNNNEFLCVEPYKVVEILTTSGTLGTPVILSLTEKDLQRLARNEQLSFHCAGINNHDIVQLMCTMDKRFMAGLAWYLGLRKLGAGIVRVGSGVPQLQWDSINRLKPTVVACVPSFLKTIIEYAEQNGIDYQNSSIKKVVCIGESIKKQDGSYNLLAQSILDKWDVQLLSTYASTEMATSFTECPYHCGGHHHPELLICEIVDKNGDPVMDGEYGELVVTTLGVEAMPLLRFKTGDITTRYSEKCKCGRQTFRLGPIVGRLNQMIKYKGTALYPPAVFDVLDNSPFVENYLVRLKSSSEGLDVLIVNIGLKAGYGKEIVKTLKDHFRTNIRVTPEINILPVDIIQKLNYPPTSRKIVRFIDERN